MLKAKRTSEGYAKHKARSKEYKRLKRATDPEYMEIDRQRAAAYYKKNRDILLTQKQTWSDPEKRKRYNESRRQKRKLNPDAAKAADAKSRANSIKRYIANYARGLISADELDRRLRKSLKQVDERYKRADSARGWDAASGGSEREGGGGLCKADTGANKA